LDEQGGKNWLAENKQGELLMTVDFEAIVAEMQHRDLRVKARSIFGLEN